MTPFDPRLQIDQDIADHIAMNAFGHQLVDTVVTTEYPAALTRVLVDGRLMVRAATGAEVESLLSSGNVFPDDTLTSPNDPPDLAGMTITWVAARGAEAVEEPAVVLWMGEVLFNDGKGLSGPLFVFRAAATAWAFSTALDQNRETVFSAQIVRYHCARSLAPGLLTGSEADIDRAIRYEASPLRPVGQVQDVPLPPFSA